MCIGVQVPEDDRGSDLLGAGVTDSCESPNVAAGSHLSSIERTVCAPNSWAISPASKIS